MFEALDEGTHHAPCSSATQANPDTSSNNNQSDLPRSSSTEDDELKKTQDRIVQVSTPTHGNALLNAISNLRKEVATTNVSIIVQGNVIRAHRFVVASFSKFLARALSPSFKDGVFVPSDVATVDGIQVEIVEHLLDYMYGNLAIIKESQLLAFLKAARHLEVEVLQTPGLLSLERNLASSSSDPPPKIEDEGVCQKDDSFQSALKSGIKFPGSLSIIDSNGKDLCFDSGQDRKGFGSFGHVVKKEKDGEINRPEETCKCCRCHCTRENRGRDEPHRKRSIEDTEDGCSGSSDNIGPKKRESMSPETTMKQSLVNRLQKFGTMVTSPSKSVGILDVPAWLFTSKNVSITPTTPPAKEVSKATTTYKSPSHKPTPITKDDHEDLDAPIIIDSPPRKQPPQSAKKNLAPKFQANSQPRTGSQVPRVGPPRYVRPGGHPRIGHPGPPRQAFPTSTFRNRLPRPSPSPIRQQTPYRQQFLQTPVIKENKPRPIYRAQGYPPPTLSQLPARTNTSYYTIPNPSWGSNLNQQAAMLRGPYPYDKPTMSSTSFRGRGRARKYVNTEGPPPQGGTLQEPPTPSTVIWDGSSPLEITGSGITVQLSDSAAEILSGNSILPSANSTKGDDHPEPIPPFVPVAAVSETETMERQRPSFEYLVTSEKPLSFDDLPEGSGDCSKVGDAVDGEEKQPSDESMTESNMKAPVNEAEEPKTMGRKTFTCQVCQKMFRTPSSLLMHKRSHGGERPYFCSSCTFRSGYLTSLKKHIFNKHRRKILRDAEQVRHILPAVQPDELNKRKRGRPRKEVEEKDGDGERGADGRDTSKGKEPNEEAESGEVDVEEGGGESHCEGGSETKDGEGGDAKNMTEEEEEMEESTEPGMS